jgi:hypothetical protein
VSVQTEPGSADRQPSTGDRGTAQARARSATASPSTSEPRPSAPAAKQRLAAVTVGDASYIEAESGELQGFTITSDATASGGAHVESLAGRVDSSPNAGPRAAYDFSVERSGRYVTWVRLRGPHVQADSFFARMDGGPWFETGLTTGDASTGSRSTTSILRSGGATRWSSRSKLAATASRSTIARAGR